MLVFHFKQPAMDEHLQLLISHYKAEQQNLQSLLKECLSEQDLSSRNIT